MKFLFEERRKMETLKNKPLIKGISPCTVVEKIIFQVVNLPRWVKRNNSGKELDNSSFE